MKFYTWTIEIIDLVNTRDNRKKEEFKISNENKKQYG